MAEALGAAASILGIIGFSAQIFDGCVKGFVLLSSARHLGRDAVILRSMLDWEHYRLEQWAEQVGLHDPATADSLLDWTMITDTLKLIQGLVGDTDLLKEKYQLVLSEKPPSISLEDDAKNSMTEKDSTSRFRRLFAMSERNATAIQRVIQSKNSNVKRLWWASVDKTSMRRLCEDIAYFVQRLYDCLNSTLQQDMRRGLETLLQQAADRYENVPDLDFLRELATTLRKDPPPYELEDSTDDITEAIDRKFRARLFVEIRDGDIEQVRLLLDDGINADCENHYGWSTLLMAAEVGHLDICRLLLERGADPLHGTIGNRRPLHVASECGHTEVVRLLLGLGTADVNYQDTSGETALFKAARGGKAEVAELLLQQPGIDVNLPSTDGFTPLLHSMFEGNVDFIMQLLRRPDIDPNCKDKVHEQTALWMATSGSDAILKTLLALDNIEIEQPARFGETALCRSARQAYHKSMALLLAAEADINAQDETGRTPVMLAAKNGNETGLALLLAQGLAHLNHVDKHKATALHGAAEGNHTKCVKALTGTLNDKCYRDPQQKLDLEIQNDFGRTPLAVACSNGYKIPAKFLLKAGANINTQDNKGNTPLALATEGKHEIVVRLLLENGADAGLGDEDEETPFEKARDAHLDDIVRLFRESAKI